MCTSTTREPHTGADVRLAFGPRAPRKARVGVAHEDLYGSIPVLADRTANISRHRHPSDHLVCR